MLKSYKLILFWVFSSISVIYGVSVDLVKISTIAWIPTNIPPISGTQNLRLYLKNFNMCEAYKTHYMEDLEVGSLKHSIVQRAIDHCTERFSELIEGPLKALKNKYERAEILGRSRREAKQSEEIVEMKVDDISDDYDKSAWGILYDSIPLVNGLVWYFDKSSEFNQVPKIARTLKQTVENNRQAHERISQIEKTLKANERYNRINIDAIASLARTIKFNAQQTMEVAMFMTKFSAIISKMDHDFKRDQEFLARMTISFATGTVDMKALGLVAPELAERWSRLRQQDIHFKGLISYPEFESDAYTMRIEVQAPIVSPRTTIFESVKFKDWTDERKYVVPKNYPHFSMYNATSNCSKYLHGDEAKICYESCTKTNQSLDIKIPDEFDTIRVQESQLAREIYPTMYTLDDRILIQCYQNNITIDGSTMVCRREPFSIDVRHSIQLGELSHSYHNEAQTVNQHESRMNSSLDRPLKIMINPWQEELDNVLRNLTQMRLAQSELELSNSNFANYNFRTLWRSVSESPTTSCAYIMSVLAILYIIYCVFKKNSITELIETMMQMKIMESMMSAKNSKPGRSDSTDGIHSGSMPSININLGQQVLPIHGHLGYPAHIRGDRPMYPDLDCLSVASSACPSKHVDFEEPIPGYINQPRTPPIAR